MIQNREKKPAFFATCFHTPRIKIQNTLYNLIKTCQIEIFEVERKIKGNMSTSKSKSKTLDFGCLEEADY